MVREADKPQWQSVGERERERERESVIGGLKYQWNSFSFATVFQQYYMIGDRKWGHAYHNLKRTSFVELIVNGLICVNFNMKKKVGVAISTRRYSSLVLLGF